MKRLLHSWRRTQYYWRIFWLFRRFELMNTFVHRGDFFFWMTVNVMWTFFNFFFLGLVANISGGIGSWTPNEVYLLMSIFTIMDTFTWSVFYHNMRTYTESVFSGQFSMTLIQPIHPIFVLTTRRNSYTNILRGLIGVGGLVITLQNLAQAPSLVQIVFMLVLMIAALAFIYGLWFILTTLSFWVERIDNINEIIPSIRRIWQLPREVYQGALGVLLTLIIPVGLTTSLPAEVIMGRNVWGWAVYFTAFSIGIWVVAYYFFKISVRRYSSIGG